MCISNVREPHPHNRTTMQSLIVRLALIRKTLSGTIDDNKISIMYTLFYSCFPLITSLNEKNWSECLLVRKKRLTAVKLIASIKHNPISLRELGNVCIKRKHKNFVKLTEYLIIKFIVSLCKKNKLVIFPKKAIMF